MSLTAYATNTMRYIPRYVTHTLRTPLLRNGHLLTVSSGLTGVIGLVYWAITALRYDPASVGRNSAAVSMMMLLAGVAQLDLANAMVRFVPGAGAGTRRLVAYTYVTASGLGVLVSGGFVLIAPLVAPGVTYFDYPLAGPAFMVATAAYTLFTIQDGVLTGLRRAAWVPVENAAFSVAKVGFVVLLATAMPEHGIFVSWLLPVVAAVLVVGGLLFGWAIPHHQRIERTEVQDRPGAREIARFVLTGYAGAVCSLASFMLLPVLVIEVLGAAANAGFAVAWVIAYSLHLVNVNMGSSLVVENAGDRAGLRQSCRQVLSHISRLLVPAVLVVVIAAPLLLGLLGPAYSAASGTLRLLSLAALPHLVVVVAISAARVQRRMSFVFLVQAAQCVLALGSAWLLLPRIGLPGVGLAWLLTQTVLAGFVVLRRDLWLPMGER